MNPVTVGLLGSGAIAPAYLRHLTGSLRRQVQLVACSDVFPEAAKKRAEEFGVPRSCSGDELLADPSVEMVINLTPAPLHHATTLQALRAGKHVFSEKPLAMTREEGAEIVREAAARGLQVGGASDTFLGGGLQKARALVDGGAIGEPLGATCLVSIPAFSRKRYHHVFRGALLDLGPYYLTALVHLLGPARAVAALGGIRWPKRTDPGQDGRPAEEFTLDLPGTTAGAVEFVSGAVASVLSSHDVHGYFPRMELFGTEASLIVGDANGYHGTMTLRTHKGDQVIEASAEDGWVEKGRGLGVAEMAAAIRAGRPARANGVLMAHVLDLMLGHYESSRTGVRSEVTVACERPAVFARSELAELVV